MAAENTVLKISKSAVCHNVRMIRLHTRARIIAVVKENAYGTGLLEMWRTLASCGVDFFAVSDPDEALALRAAGCSGDILLLSPEQSRERCAKLLAQDIVMMLGNREQAEVLRAAAAAARRIPRVHLAVDTGLGRYGFRWNRLEDVRACTQGMKVEGCYTHFATASRSWEQTVRRQKEHFDEALSALSAQGISCGLTHACASRAFLHLGDLGYDAVRPGSLLLGCCPEAEALGYRRAVWLETPIDQITRCPRGSHVGYDGQTILKRDTAVGLLRAGYADGIFIGRRDGEGPFLHQLLRVLRHGLLRRDAGEYAKIKGRHVPVLGRAGLGHMLLDLTDGEFAVGDTATFLVNPVFVPERVARTYCAEPAPQEAQRRVVVANGDGVYQVS